jgi:hypothetical protein
LRRPRLRACALRLLDNLPVLRGLLRRALRDSSWQTPRSAHMPRNVDDLSPATHAAYCALQAALDRRQRP